MNYIVNLEKAQKIHWRKKKNIHPLTRNYHENDSLRIIFVIFAACCTLEISRKGRLFRGITCEIRNFYENNCFRVTFREQQFCVRGWVETATPNCGFLSLVVVERVLRNKEVAPGVLEKMIMSY